MKITVQKIINQEYELKKIHIKAEVRYWEDAQVNGFEDVEGNLIPCKENKNWCPIIDVDLGIIDNWIIGNYAKIHYKVCDGFMCNFIDNNNGFIHFYEGYVPDFMCPNRDGDGDYIIMNINNDGVIENWDKNQVKKFLNIINEM